MIRQAIDGKSLFLFDVCIAIVLLGVLLVSTPLVDHWIPGNGPETGWVTASIVLLLGFGPVLLFSWIERFLTPAGPRKTPRQWFLHLKINILYSFANLLAGALAATAVVGLNRRYGLGFIDLRFASGKGVPALIAAFFLGALIRDFLYYCYHWIVHKVAFLWQIHKLHHMDQELDVLSTTRESWIDAFISTFFLVIPAAAIFKLDDVDPYSIGLLGGFICGSFNSFAGSFTHLNAKLHLGWASTIWNGPQLHRIHHSRLPQHRDKNLCLYLPIWDVLFGTYYAPARDEYPPTGVDGEKEIESVMEAGVFTFREWWKMLRRAGITGHAADA